MSIQKLFLGKNLKQVHSPNDDNALMLQLNSSCIQVTIVGGTP